MFSIYSVSQNIDKCSVFAEEPKMTCVIHNNNVFFIKFLKYSTNLTTLNFYDSD